MPPRRRLIASHGVLMAAPALMKIKDLVRNQLEQRAQKGERIYWNNFSSAWQKLSAGRGRAKKLGQGFSDKLVAMEAEEATELLIEKAGSVYGLMIVGSSSAESEVETSDDEGSPPLARSSPMGHDGSEGQFRPSSLGHGGTAGKGKAAHEVKGKQPMKEYFGKGAVQQEARTNERKGAREGPLPWEKGHPANLRRKEMEGRNQVNLHAASSEGRPERGQTWAQRLKGKPAQRTVRQGKGPAVSSPQPSWEKLNLVQDEWDTDIITQEELVQGDGLALVSKQFLYDNYEALCNTWGKAAAIIPTGIGWFAEKPRTPQFCELLKQRKEVNFVCTYDEDGRRVVRIKTGLLLQLSRDAYEKVQQRTNGLDEFFTPHKKEVSLEVVKDLMPAKKWEEACRDPREFIENALVQASGANADDLTLGYTANKGEAFAVIAKVPDECLSDVLTNIDRYFVFARKTVRGQDKDEEHVPLWLPQRRGADLLMQVRDVREHARRQAGGSYKGIAMRYRQGYQIGVRVQAEHAPLLRERILPKKMQPAEEARGVHGRAYYRVLGLPADLDKKTCSAELHRFLKWPTIPMREWAKPGLPTADWVVAADDPPPKWLFHIHFLGREGIFPVVIEEEIPKDATSRVLTPNVGNFAEDRVRGPSGPKYFFSSCWNEDESDDGADHEMDIEQDEKSTGYDEDPASTGAYGKAAAAVAAGKSKGCYPKGKSGPVEGRSQPATPIAPTCWEYSDDFEQDRPWSKDQAAPCAPPPQSHFIGESGLGEQLQMMMQTMQVMMQKIEAESAERQMQMHQIQQEQASRNDRADAFEKLMLGFKDDTERRFRESHEEETSYPRGRKGPRAPSTSEESRGRDRGRSRTEERRRARRKTANSDEQDGEY